MQLFEQFRVSAQPIESCIDYPAIEHARQAISLGGGQKHPGYYRFSLLIDQSQQQLEMLKLEQKERIANADREQRREKERLEAQTQAQSQEQDAIIEGVKIGVKAATDADKIDLERSKRWWQKGSDK